jgi:Protein of unknown function (DUF2489)
MNRPTWVMDEKQWLRDCRSVTTACRGYLAGTLGLIEASRLLVSCAHRLREDSNSEFSFFVAVESETDHLPVGEYRNQWAADSLKAKDKEINSIEEFYRSDAVAAATSLLKRFQEAEQPAHGDAEESV